MGPKSYTSDRSCQRLGHGADDEPLDFGRSGCPSLVPVRATSAQALTVKSLYDKLLRSAPGGIRTCDLWLRRKILTLVSVSGRQFYPFFRDLRP